MKFVFSFLLLVCVPAFVNAESIQERQNKALKLAIEKKDISLIKSLVRLMGGTVYMRSLNDAAELAVDNDDHDLAYSLAKAFNQHPDRGHKGTIYGINSAMHRAFNEGKYGAAVSFVYGGVSPATSADTVRLLKGVIEKDRADNEEAVRVLVEHKSGSIWGDEIEELMKVLRKSPRIASYAHIFAKEKYQIPILVAMLKESNAKIDRHWLLDVLLNHRKERLLPDELESVLKTGYWKDDIKDLLKDAKTQSHFELLQKFGAETPKDLLHSDNVHYLSWSGDSLLGAAKVKELVQAEWPSRKGYKPLVSVLSEELDRRVDIKDAAAADKEAGEYTKWLLKHGANVNEKIDDRFTPIYNLLFSGHWDATFPAKANYRPVIKERLAALLATKDIDLYAPEKPRQDPYGYSDTRIYSLLEWYTARVAHYGLASPYAFGSGPIPGADWDAIQKHNEVLRKTWFETVEQLVASGHFDKIASKEQRDSLMGVLATWDAFLKSPELKEDEKKHLQAAVSRLRRATLVHDFPGLHPSEIDKLLNLQVSKPLRHRGFQPGKSRPEHI
jgi:hypothetical protein